MGDCLLAIPALAQELKKMASYLKTGLPGQLLLQFTEITIGKGNYGTATGANQVMMVF